MDRYGAIELSMVKRSDYFERYPGRTRMIDPNQNRIDYGDNLRAPVGFDLSYAIATTFSLDLDALLCLPVALCLDSTLEGDLKGEKMAMLEAIGQLSGRLKVFFQQGNISAPHSFNRLFTLLEPCIVPVVPGEVFSSFHPKVWLLRFIDARMKVRYRLLVLSRNLTFDRSWDLAVTLEGEVSDARNAESDGLIDLLTGLASKAPDFAVAFSAFKKELPFVQWARPPGFGRLETLLGDDRRVPINFGRGTDSILVISPFLHPKALDFLKSKAANRWLFSRAEEMNRIGEARLADWECYCLSERVVSGEDDIDDLDHAMVQNLHAKAIFVKNGDTTHWHVGSANATTAALGDGTALPRNTEFMLRMSGSGSDLSPQQAIHELVGSPEEPTGIFVRHVFEAATEIEEPLDSQVRRQLVHQLINTQWTVSARSDDENTYTCSVGFSPDFRNIAPEHLAAIEVGQISFGSFKPLSSPLVWSGMATTQISAFLRLRIVIGVDAAWEGIVKAALKIEGGDRRDQKIYAELIDSQEKFMAYVQMLLQPDCDRAELFGIDLSRSFNTAGDGALNKLISGPVFESLLRSASRQPEQLRRIDILLNRLNSMNVKVPVKFQHLWKQYKTFLGTTK